MICFGHGDFLESREMGFGETHGAGENWESLLQLELTKLDVIVLVQNIYHMCYLAMPTTPPIPTFHPDVFGKKEFSL